MAEKSDVNDLAVMFTAAGDVLPVDVVVEVVLDDGFDELPHADAATTAAATIATAAARRIDHLRTTPDDPISKFSTSISCHPGS